MALNSGLVTFGNVTNTYGGYLQSGGVAYDLVTPWQADMLEWWRYTAYGTAGTLGQGVWFRDFPAGDSLIHRAIADNGATGNLNLVLETTNGVTVNNTAAGFTAEQVTITNAVAATWTITATSHGLSVGDRVFITKIVGTIGPSLNNKEWVVGTVPTANTFTITDVYGNNPTLVGTYTSGGQLNKEGPELDVQNSPAVYRLTLGTSIMGADNDVIYFRASMLNNYVNLGDVA